MNIIILLFICIIKLHVIPLKVESMSFSSNNYSSEVNKSFYKFIIIFLLYYIFPRLLFKFVNSRYIYFNKRNFFIICIYEIKLLIIYFLLYLKFNILFFKLFSFYCIMILGIFKFIIFSFLRIYSKYQFNVLIVKNRFNK